jgi:hypothetical protein
VFTFLHESKHKKVFELAQRLIECGEGGIRTLGTGLPSTTV